MSTPQGPRPYYEASTSSRQDAHDVCEATPPTVCQLSSDHTYDPAPNAFDTEPAHHHGLQPRITTRGWSLNDILKISPNFRRIARTNYSSPANSDMTAYEETGIPLIVHGWNRHPKWAKTIFNVEWLRKNGDQNPSVRNVHNWMDFNLSVDTFIEKLRASPVFTDPNETERLYGKDGECPIAWTEWLRSKDVIPEELLFDGPNDFLRFLPETAKVQTLMCYMGIGDTFTPFHKDLCASSGHNLMCYTEKGGSSYWFMTKTSDAPQVASYFHDLGHELDLETHVVTIDELAKAPFDVYIGEQALGDLVLVPPRSCHQVINNGGITIKTSWSRMSLEGLQVALWHELPIYHRVCRSEIYKVKSNIYHALQHYTDTANKLSGANSEQDRAVSIEKLKQLFALFDDVLAEEFSTMRDSMSHISRSGSGHNDDMTCDFCAADIFQSFFECESCAPSSSSRSSQDVITLGDGLILCPLCYVEGRTCRCGNMEPVQCRPFNDLLQARDKAMQVIRDADNSFTKDHVRLSEHPSRLLSNQHAGVFEAACKLHQQRQFSTKANRSCRVTSGGAHLVEWSAAVPCKSCHSSRCYTHLLQSNSVHSIEAIFISERHEGGAGWHRHHRDNTHKFRSYERRIVEDEKCGVRPDMLLRLAYLAKKYDICRVVNAELTKYGWYDRYVQLIGVPFSRTPDKILVGLSDHAGEDATSSETSGNVSRAASRKPVSQLGSLVIKIPASRQAQRGSPIPDVSIISAMPGEPRSSSGRNLPNSSSTYASVEGASTPTSSREHFGDPPAASVFTAGSDPGDQEMSGSVSDLTELPTEFDSSPQAPSEIPSKSVVMKPSSPSVVLPISLSPHHKPRRRVFMECVEIPRPAWYRKRAQCMPETQPVVPRRRKLSQSDSWHPSLQKRTRSLTVVPDSSSTDTLANALNKTFKYNSSTRGHDEGTFNDSEIKHEKERRYRDIGVETRPRFTKLPPTVTAREQDDTIAKLQGEKSELEMALQAVHRELEIYRQRDEAWALASQMKPSFVPPPAHSISQAISHLPSRPASQFTTRSRPPVASSDALLTSLDIDQEPLLPPIETIPPSMPTSLASSSKREPTAVSQQPRKHTPTEPRSYRLQAAVTPPPKRGNAQHVKARQHALCERSFLGREPSRAHRRKAPTATIPQPDLRQHRAEDATEEAPPPSLSYSAASQINGTVDRGAWTP